MAQIFPLQIQLLVIPTYLVSWEDRPNSRHRMKPREGKRTEISTTNLGKSQIRVVTLWLITINQHNPSMLLIIVVSLDKRDRVLATSTLNYQLLHHRPSQRLVGLILLFQKILSRLQMETRIQIQVLECTNIRKTRKNQGPDSLGNLDSQLHRKKSKI